MTATTTTTRTDTYYQKAKALIPGGTQLLSKRPEMWAPGQWPAYYSSAAGCKVADLDGNEYLDMATSGLGACVLGYADRDVDQAVAKAIHKGSASSLNPPEEVELAELLLELHPWARMARYARSGGEAMAVAVRIAEARNRGKEGASWEPGAYHGWHINDPFSGTPSGIENPAAVIFEIARHGEPDLEALTRRVAKARAKGSVVIFDEISTGFRRTVGGIHLHYGVAPDMAVFAKAISNGYPMAAVIGTEDVMQAAQDTFISSTSWSERIGPTASIATIRKFREKNVHSYLEHIGRLVQLGWSEAAKYAELPVTVSGIPQLSHIEFTDQATATLFTQEMLKRGILAGKSFYPTFAHTTEHILEYTDACLRVFEDIARGRAVLEGPVAGRGRVV